MRGEEIKGNLVHDAGAYARCSYCGRYSDKPGSLRGYVKCDCGKEGGWCGSFKKPDEKSEWSNVNKENKPPRKNHPYYGTRYSVAVLGWDNEGNLILNLICWDYQTRGWVQADLREGPNPGDYELEVATWLLPPDMPNTPITIKQKGQ